MLRAVSNVVAAVPGRARPRRLLLGADLDRRARRGWDPADPASGDGWENQALFDFDDRLLPTVKGFLRS